MTKLNTAFSFLIMTKTYFITAKVFEAIGALLFLFCLPFYSQILAYYLSVWVTAIDVGTIFVLTEIDENFLMFWAKGVTLLICVALLFLVAIIGSVIFLVHAFFSWVGCFGWFTIPEEFLYWMGKACIYTVYGMGAVIGAVILGVLGRFGFLKWIDFNRLHLK